MRLINKEPEIALDPYRNLLFQALVVMGSLIVTIVICSVIYAINF